MSAVAAGRPLSSARAWLVSASAIACALASAPAWGQSAGTDLQAQISAARDQIIAQQRRLDAQEERLRELEARLAGSMPLPLAGTAVAAAQGSGATVSGDPAGIQQAPMERVGQAPDDEQRPIEVAVLGEQGAVLTRRGQLSGDVSFEYARADRNRAVFRGIEIVEAVLIGVFDINENRQDILTAAGSLRYGLTNRFEIGVRVPYVHRSDSSVLTPIQGSTADDAAATIDTSARGSGIGDVELSMRYQITNAGPRRPFLVANLQAVLPTGEGPFEVPRDSLGRATRAATGGGFYGFSPSVTAILPTDPVVLFGTLGYTYNPPAKVDTRIPPVQINWVDPGDSLSFSAGVGIAFNDRTSVNFGYAHTWAFGTRTRTSLIDPPADDPGPVTRRSRDLQIGRFLFGVTYRVTDRSSLNWSVEIGATEDATDLRTTLRIPFVLLGGG